jgi:hypothetical protein
MDTLLAAALRKEVRAFVAAAGTRRSLPTTCRVGRPSEQPVELPHVAGMDCALRTDLVERALDGLLVTDGACAWLTRAGGLETSDADVEWYAAARTAFARHDLALTAFCVLNRTGWVDLVSGQRRQWTRVRTRTRSATPG